MRLDHIAFRTENRHVTAQFFLNEPFNYRIQTEFDIPDLNTKCLVLIPPEKSNINLPFFTQFDFISDLAERTQYHLAPEIFISSSFDINSPVGAWVNARNGKGGVHHLAYNVSNVLDKMNQLKELGWEFTTDGPISDGDLIQCFTKPVDALGGLIIEFIDRPYSRGFSLKNVSDLMRSTVNQ